MSIFLGNTNLLSSGEPTRPFLITSTQTVTATNLSVTEGTIIKYIITSGYFQGNQWFYYTEGDLMVKDANDPLVCTVAGFNGHSTIAGFGNATISTSNTIYQPLYGTQLYNDQKNITYSRIILFI